MHCLALAFHRQDDYQCDYSEDSDHDGKHGDGGVDAVDNSDKVAGGSASILFAF